MSRLRLDSFLSTAMERSAYVLAAPLSIAGCASFLKEHADLFADPFFFATAKVDVDSVGDAHALEGVGFNLIDTTLQFERALSSASVEWTGTVRRARAEDEDAVRAIARNNLIKSRFHLDPRIDNELACEVKAQWAGNYFYGKRGDAMLVAELAGKVIGFLQLLYTESAVIIDLIAVDNAARRCGAASALIFHAMTDKPQMSSIIVGTQAANIGGVRFYESMGFRFSGAKYVFHAHGGKNCK